MGIDERHGGAPLGLMGDPRSTLPSIQKQKETIVLEMGCETSPGID